MLALGYLRNLFDTKPECSTLVLDLQGTDVL